MDRFVVTSLFATISLVSIVDGASAQTHQHSSSNNRYQQYRGRVAYAPVGLVIPLRLSTGISTEVAQAGDPIQATVTQTIQLGMDAASIPSGSIVRGQITDAVASGRMGHSGHLGVKFTTIDTPDGAHYPINAHLVGGIDRYHQVGDENSDQFKGETGWTKLKAAGLHTAIGAGAGAALGTAVGGIAGGGRGAGKGAWSGTAIGAGLGAAESLLLRKGKQITIKPGTPMQLQLDSPVSIAAIQTHVY